MNHNDGEYERYLRRDLRLSIELLFLVKKKFAERLSNIVLTDHYSFWS